MTTNELQRLVDRLRAAGALRAAAVDLDLHDVDKLVAPDTPAVREAETVCRDASSASLANHCYRSYAWGAVLGIAEGIAFDAETFYVSALLHDIGLTADYDRGGCFESDGADVARELAVRNGWSAERAGVVRAAIYLHMHTVSADDAPEAVLLDYGTSVDVSGRRAEEIGPLLRDAVLGAYPRLHFKEHFTELFADQAARKPHCVVAQYMAAGGAARIAGAPFDE
jgi:hypothetical protein